jgi:hypothetical protein
MNVLEGSDAAGPSRLQVAGSSLTGAWQLVLDEATGMEAHLYGCEIILTGESGGVTLRVSQSSVDGSSAVVPALLHNISVLPGAPLSTLF